MRSLDQVTKCVREHPWHACTGREREADRQADSDRLIDRHRGFSAARGVRVSTAHDIMMSIKPPTNRRRCVDKFDRRTD